MPKETYASPPIEGIATCHLTPHGGVVVNLAYTGIAPSDPEAFFDPISNQAGNTIITVSRYTERPFLGLPRQVELDPWHAYSTHEQKRLQLYVGRSCMQLCMRFHLFRPESAVGAFVISSEEYANMARPTEIYLYRQSLSADADEDLQPAVEPHDD